MPDRGWLYECTACWLWTREEDAPPPNDGRIRSPSDVESRTEGARSRAAEDARLSERDRAVHALYCELALEHLSVEVMAADEWVAEQVSASLGRRIPRQHVGRSRERLMELGYVRRLKVGDVTRYGLKAVVEQRRAAGLRSAMLVEVRKAPPPPECEVCGDVIPDGLRAWRRYCSPRCRQAAHRSRAEVLSERVTQ